MTKRRVVAVVGAPGAAPLLLAAPAAEAAPRTNPRPRDFEVMSPLRNRTLRPAFGQYRVFNPFRVSGRATVDSQVVGHLDDVKPAPVPASAITCSFAPTFQDEPFTSMARMVVVAPRPGKALSRSIRQNQRPLAASTACKGDGEMGNANRDSVPRLELHALGRFGVSVADKPVAGLDGRRAQELLTYVVLNRERVFARETLAETLWAEGCEDTRKTLRQVLWQVQSALAAALDTPVLTTEGGFVGLRPDACVHADVIAIEVAHRQAHAARAGPLDDAVVTSLREAASYYRGDLLQHCCTDWCVVERERLRAMYLAILEKLMVNAEAAGDLSDGLWYGEQVLRHDRASERTHRRLMALRYLSGDRTGAMRQYESCTRALAEELDVGPGPATRELDAIIRRGLALHPAGGGAAPLAAGDGTTDPLQILRVIHTTLRNACDQVASALTALGDGATRRSSDG